MTKFMARAALAASVSVLALGAAQAGGLTNTSQSSVFNGMGYAGFAAPGSESAATMFMNPATMTSFTRLTIDTNYTFGVPTTKMVTAAGAHSGDIALNYFVPATYVIYPLNDRFTLGISLNTPYGSSNKPEQSWVGSALAHTTKLRALTATPSLAYKINNEWSVGIGLQLQYASARMWASPAPGLQAGIMDASGYGVGWTAGVTWTPTKTTQIGLGWRSFVDQKLSGTTHFLGANDPNASGTLNLPNRVNLSLRQTFTPKFDLLASVEWQNYGRLGDAALKTAFPALRRLPLGYSDAWMFSIGGEYKYNAALTLRAGVAYEISPVTDAIRRPTVPDNNRLWLSSGLSYKLNERFALNASYSYVHVEKAPIAQGAFVATAKAHAHLASFGITSKWGEPPVREAAIIRKY